MKRYESYKDSGQQWLGEVPSHWKVRRSKYVWRESFESSESGIEQLLSVSQYDGITINTNRSRSESLVGYKIVKPDDLVINIMLAWMGGLGVSQYNGLVSPAYCVYSSFVDCIPRYFHYLYSTNTYLAEFARKSTGVIPSRWRMYTEDFGTVYSIVPPKDEQEAIVSYLDAVTADIDKAIAQQQRMIDLLNERKQIIIQKELLPNIAQKKESEMWFGALPPKWQSVRLKYILAERNERSETGSEEPLSMSQKYGLIPTSQMDVIPNMAASFVGAKKAYIGDLVFNKLKAHLGVFAVSEYNGLVSPDYAVYYANSKVNLKYLQFLFKNPMMIAEFRRRSSGVGEGLTRLYTKDLFSIYIPLPSLEEQNRVVENIEFMTKQIANHIAFCENTIKLLLERKRIIINDVVTGKVKVS